MSTNNSTMISQKNDISRIERNKPKRVKNKLNFDQRGGQKNNSSSLFKSKITQINVNNSKI